MPRSETNYVSEITIRISLEDGKYKGHINSGGDTVVTMRNKEKSKVIGWALGEAREHLLSDTIELKSPDITKSLTSNDFKGPAQSEGKSSTGEKSTRKD